MPIKAIAMINNTHPNIVKILFFSFFIVFIIISFAIEDRVYLFLSIGVLCTVLLWTGIEAIVCYVKNKEPKEKEIC